MSDYFTYSNLTPNTVARASDVNARFQGVSAGFDMLPPPQFLRDDRLTYSTAGGTANALTANPATPILAYNEGLHITVKAINANTGAATINVSSLGVKNILRADGTALQAGDIVVGQILDMTYDGTQFRLSMAFGDISPAGVVAKLQAAGSFSLGTNALLTFPGTGGVIINGVTLDGLTAAGRDLAEAASVAAQRSLLGLGTMALETAANYALLASPAFTGNPTAPTQLPGNNTTRVATTEFVTTAVAAVSTAGLAPLASPVFTGDPQAPTPATADNDTSIATTAYVKSNLASYATLASPTFTGTPAAPTAAPGTNTTQLASTAFVTAAVAAVGAGTTTNALTFNNSGTGDVSGSTFNGSAARTLSHNSIGAAPLASPALTGTPTAPTAAVDTNTTQLATTAYVVGNGYLKSATAASTYAPLASPALTGNPTAPTQASGNNTTRLATTAFVQDALGVVTTSAGANSITPTFADDVVQRLACTAAVTLNNPTGTARDGHGIVIRLRDNGTARAISYGTQYRAVGVTLPGTTVINKMLILGMIFNSTDTKWDVVSVAQEA